MSVLMPVIPAPFDKLRSRNPEMLSSGHALCAWRFLESGESRNDSIVYQFIHASVILPLPDGEGIRNTPA